MTLQLIDQTWILVLEYKVLVPDLDLESQLLITTLNASVVDIKCPVCAPGL